MTYFCHSELDSESSIAINILDSVSSMDDLFDKQTYCRFKTISKTAPSSPL
jgi:hypothetical protein